MFGVQLPTLLLEGRRSCLFSIGACLHSSALKR